MANYTKQDLMESYRIGMHRVAGEMCHLVGDEHAASIALLPVDDVYDAGLKNLPNADVLSTPAARLVEQTYEFGVEGMLGDALAEEYEDGEGLTPWITRFEGLNAFVSWEYGSSTFRNCIHALRVAQIRSTFAGSHTVDAEGMVWNCILLSEFALLAGVEEKTLRNIANPKHRQHLPTTKIGKRTYVALSDAIPWLEKRGFPQSAYTNTDPSRDFERRPFLSQRDLVRFVEAQRESLGLTNEDIAAHMKIVENSGSTLQDLLTSTRSADKSVAMMLGEALNLPDPKAFALALSDLSVPVSQFPRAPRRTQAKRRG